jgi:hypothetical protein
MRQQRSKVLRLALSGLACLLLAVPPATAQPAAETPPPPRPRLAALAVDEPLKVDGLLDDEAWQRADVASRFIQREPNPGQPATEPTEVRVVYTSSTLYVGIRAQAADPSQIVGEEMQRDGALFRDDSVLVLLDTFNDDRNAYFFEVNPNGAFTDALVTDEGRVFNVQWDAVWRAVAQRTAGGWTAEMEIPFATLRFDPKKDTWGLNVRRLIRHKNEEVFWGAIPLEANLFRISLAGDLTGIRGPEPGLNLRIKPFAVGSASKLRTPAGEVSEEDADVGLDLKWGLTRQMTLDLTYNTDFAEVEVDDQQINLTRFSLFFPEKREFFLENAGLFEFGFGTPGTPYLKPFFSRRIGVSPFGTVVPMDWGARLTGRAGPWSIGMLDAQTGSYRLHGLGEQPEDNWAVVRVKRNLGQRSNVGFIATNRDQEGIGTNRVTGLDGSFKPNQNTTLAAFYTHSETDKRFLLGSEDVSDWAGGAQAMWEGPTSLYALDFLQIGEDYNPESGFLLRSNIRRYVPRFVLEPRPAVQGRIRNYHFGVTGDIITDLKDETQTVQVGADLFGVVLRSEDQIVLFADHTLDRVPSPFFLGDVEIPAGEYEFNDAGFSYATNNSRRLAVDGYVLAGGFYGGDRLSGVMNVGVRASRHVRSDTTWVHDNLDLPGGTFTSNIVRQRLGLSVSPTLFANTYVQYNDAAELVSLNLRFNWLYRPGADLFIVFNQNWSAPGLSDLTARDRAVIVKFTYLFGL